MNMHGGFGFVNPSAGAGIPEAGWTADDIIDMVSGASDLDKGEAIRARTRITEAFINAGLVGSESASTLDDPMARLVGVASVGDLGDLSRQVYQGLQVPAAQQLQLPHGFGDLSRLTGAEWGRSRRCRGILPGAG